MPCLLAGEVQEEGEGERKPWNQANTSRHTAVISAILATNPKQSSIGAAIEEVNSIPARPYMDSSQCTWMLSGG